MSKAPAGPKQPIPRNQSVPLLPTSEQISLKVPAAASETNLAGTLASIKEKHRFSGEFSEEGLTAIERLRDKSPDPYAARSFD